MIGSYFPAMSVHFEVVMGTFIIVLIISAFMFGSSNILADLYVASTGDVPFAVGWKRVRHIRNGHKFEGSTLIEKQHYDKHPHSDDELVYTISIRECECGLIFEDKGLNYRDSTWMRGI